MGGLIEFFLCSAASIGVGRVIARQRVVCSAWIKKAAAFLKKGWPPAQAQKTSLYSAPGFSGARGSNK
jgi:hypothetical protein